VRLMQVCEISFQSCVKFKMTGGKFFFRVVVDDVVTTSRKYTTELMVQKGIDEIVKWFRSRDFRFSIMILNLS
jgi:hypothetical protein